MTLVKTEKVDGANLFWRTLAYGASNESNQLKYKESTKYSSQWPSLPMVRLFSLFGAKPLFSRRPRSLDPSRKHLFQKMSRGNCLSSSTSHLNGIRLSPLNGLHHCTGMRPTKAKMAPTRALCFSTFCPCSPFYSYTHLYSKVSHQSLLYQDVDETPTHTWRRWGWG